MYDTALQNPKVYKWLMREWTKEELAWADHTPVLLGVPAYADADTGYHQPHVENLAHALQGIHAGLSNDEKMPANYQGTAIYCEWEMNGEKWNYFREHFVRVSSNSFPSTHQ